MSKKLSRRDFLKMSFLGAVGMSTMGFNSLPKTILPTDGFIPDMSRDPKLPALLDLPILHTQKTPVYLENLTLGQDPIFLERRGLEKHWFPELLEISDMPFEILPNRRPMPELASLLDCGGMIPWVVDIPHLTGHQPARMYAVVGYGQPDESLAYKSFDLMEKKADSNIVATHAFTDKIGIYASKIYNILTAMICSLEWQKEHGPMKPGRPYSILEMCGATDTHAKRYLTGGFLSAGGICAFVTNTSKANFLISQMGYLKVLERHLHQENLQYTTNNLDPALTKLNSDATVGFVSTRPFDNPGNSDYRWEMLPGAPELYYSYRAHLKLNDQPLEPTSASRHRTQPCDARLTFTISLVKDDPLQNFDELAHLHSLRDEYRDFHNFDDLQRGGFVEGMER